MPNRVSYPVYHVLSRNKSSLVSPRTSTGTIQGYGQTITNLLALYTPPIVVKLIEKESDIPETALRPMRDWGTHYALRQAFAKSRGEGLTLAMLKEGSW